MTEPTNLSDKQRDDIEKVGRWLLGALDEIAQWADAQLRREQPEDNPNEPTWESSRASLAGVRQGAELLLQEPAIVRIVVQWQQPSRDRKTFLICRGASAGGPEVDEVPVASYRSSVGRLAEHKLGEVATVRIGDKEHTGTIIERQQWSPILDELWDAKDCAYEVEGWQRFIIASIRRFIEDVRPTTDSSLDAIDAAAEEAENVLHERDRRAIDRIALRDQPILDKHQGAVFRMPLDRRVLLIGPPGTGKTTTLIKRIAQKQTLSELPKDEVALVQSAGLDDRFSAQGGWAMFSPTELLARYLQEAFARERVPASAYELRTWQHERQRLARDVIPILRTESRGRFRKNTTTMLRSLKSLSVSALYDAFAEFHLERLASRCRNAVDSIIKSKEKESRELSALLQGRLSLESGSSLHIFQRLCPPPPLLQEIAGRIQEEIRKWTDREATRILRDNPAILEQLLPFLVEDNPLEENTDDDADPDDELRVSPPPPVDSPAISKKRALDLLRSILRTYATNAALSKKKPQGRVRKEVLSVLEGLLPPPDIASNIGRRILLRRELVALINAPRRWVFDVAVSYSQFRRHNSGLYLPDLADRNDLISGDEMDVLILLSLSNARTIQMELGGSPPPSWLSGLIKSYVPQVYIDEATDFSVVQLAALMELAHPGLRSWFACGDFRQRITHTGISSEDELRWIEKTCGIKSPIEIKSIDIPYRQSARLREFSEAINPELPILQDRTQSAYLDDPPPLLLEGADQARVSSWLAQRITEIERVLGELPSIAVFVNGDDKIEETVEAAVEPLRDHSIEIVGCPGGRIFGDAQEVRVFDVQYIKGLEFEAVFFINLDDFAEDEPELFHRFFYVGATRAATYLGITCQNEIPDRLTPVRSLFSENGW